MTSLSVGTVMATTLSSLVSNSTLHVHSTKVPTQTSSKGTHTLEFTYSPTVTETYLDGPQPDRPDSTVAVAASISCIGILVLGIGCFRLRQMNRSKRASMQNLDIDNTSDFAPDVITTRSGLDPLPCTSTSLESMQSYSRDMGSTMELSTHYLVDQVRYPGSPPEISPPPYEKRIRPP